MANYLDSRIEEALVKAKGNQTKARAVVLEMLEQDDQLLRAITRPHLTAIIAHAVNREAIQLKTAKKTAAGAAPPLPKGAKGQGGFGLDLLKALGGQNVPKFGSEDAAPPVRKKAASQDHVNALKMMAAKSKSKTK